MDALAIPLHLGALHPLETLAMAALALGPFVIVAVVVTVVSRRDRRTEGAEREPGHGAGGRAGRAPARQATREAGDGRGEAPSTANDTAAPQSVQQ